MTSSEQLKVKWIGHKIKHFQYHSFCFQNLSICATNSIWSIVWLKVRFVACHFVKNVSSFRINQRTVNCSKVWQLIGTNCSKTPVYARWCNSFSCREFLNGGPSNVFTTKIIWKANLFEIFVEKVYRGNSVQIHSNFPAKSLSI